MNFVGDSLKDYLDKNGINYTQKDVEDYLKYLGTSILIRRELMGEGDLRNGNTGILVDLKNKTFRPLPNFDMEKCFSASRLCCEELKQLYEFDSDGYDRFTDKLFEFLALDEKQESVCIKMAYKYIKDKKIANKFIKQLYADGCRLLKSSEHIKKDCCDKVKVGEDEQILA